MHADAFEFQLFGIDGVHFGNADKRNYIFHSIVGIKEKDPATDPWQPEEPIETGICTANGNGAVNAGTVYQSLSIRTGGLRFPICELDSFAAVFNQIAEGVKTASLSCAFDFPPPSHGILDPDKALLFYTPSGTTEQQELPVVDGPEACGDAGYCVEDESFHLCPALCEAAQNDYKRKSTCSWAASPSFCNGQLPYGVPAGAEAGD